RYPFAFRDVSDVLDSIVRDREPATADAIDALRPVLARELATRLQQHRLPENLPETTPGVSAAARIARANAELLDACDGFLRRCAIEMSLTRDERREILQGMLLTRARSEE